MIILQDMTVFLHLGTPLPNTEYLRMFLDKITEEIIQKYGLRKLALNSWVYIKSCKVMYGLEQSGILARQQLVRLLKP